MPEDIKVEKFDFLCNCGNTTHRQGAYPCDVEGNEVMPDDNWANLFCCDHCGRIFNGESGTVVGLRI